MKTATNIQNNPHSRNSGERKSPGPYPDTAEMPGQMRLPKMMAGRDIRKCRAPDYTIGGYPVYRADIADRWMWLCYMPGQSKPIIRDTLAQLRQQIQQRKEPNHAPRQNPIT